MCIPRWIVGSQIPWRGRTRHGDGIDVEVRGPGFRDARYARTGVDRLTVRREHIFGIIAERLGGDIGIQRSSECGRLFVHRSLGIQLCDEQLILSAIVPAVPMPDEHSLVELSGCLRSRTVGEALGRAGDVRTVRKDRK